MGVRLTAYLHHKNSSLYTDDKKDEVNGIHLFTCCGWILFNAPHMKQTGFDNSDPVILSEEELSDIISYWKEEVDKTTKYYSDMYFTINDLKAQRLLVSKTEIYNQLNEDIFQKESRFKEYLNNGCEVEDSSYTYYFYWKFALTVLNSQYHYTKDNKKYNDYDIIYTAG